MQHYGSPTRLLDWTENPLAALHFAVDKLEEDGELWALFPQALNREAVPRFGLPYPNHPVLRYLVGEPFRREEEERDNYANALGLDQPCTRPVAFRPTCLFPRMLVQSSAFTIHPKPSPGNTIAEVVTSPKGLVRYQVPKEVKSRIRADLAAIGITHRTLFPDFEGLSRHIVQRMGVVAYSPPEPPNFGRAPESS